MKPLSILPPAVATAFPSKEDRVDYIAERMSQILQALGLDLDDPSLAQTPQRVARMYVYELFSGLDPSNCPEPILFEEPTTTSCSQIVRIQGIELVSTCEHHLMPIVGTAEVAYIPKGKILGLSKVHRLLDHLARRPQLQERLTAQFAQLLSAVLGTGDVSVRIQAWHGCVSCRGVQHPQSTLTTQVDLGEFKET